MLINYYYYDWIYILINVISIFTDWIWYYYPCLVNVTGAILTTLSIWKFVIIFFNPWSVFMKLSYEFTWLLLNDVYSIKFLVIL
jgi:hypothetical protein